MNNQELVEKIKKGEKDMSKSHYKPILIRELEKLSKELGDEKNA